MQIPVRYSIHHVADSFGPVSDGPQSHGRTAAPLLLFQPLSERQGGDVQARRGDTQASQICPSGNRESKHLSRREGEGECGEETQDDGAAHTESMGVLYT